MNHIQFIASAVLLIMTLSLRAQNGVAECKEYYLKINQVELIREYEFRKNRSLDSIEMIMRKQYPYFSFDSRFNFWKSKPLLIIGIIIKKDVLDKSLDDYLYKYVAVDSNRIDLLYLDKKNRPEYWVYGLEGGNLDGIVTEPFKDKSLRMQLKRRGYKSFKSVLNKEPDLILYNLELNVKLYGAILYIKDSGIYIKPFQRRRIFELNEYFKKYGYPKYHYRGQ